MKPLLIFDFDGTLVDTEKLWHQSLDLMCDKYGHSRIKKDDFQDLLELGVWGIIKKLNFSVLKLMSLRQDVQELYKKKSDQIKLFPGMKSVLTNASKKATLCVMTSNFTDIAQHVLEKNSVLELFTEVSGIDNHRSKHSGINHLKEKYEGEVYFFGDTVEDIKEARKANVKAIAVEWGFQENNRLVAAKPDKLLSKPEEILNLI